MRKTTIITLILMLLATCSTWAQNNIYDQFDNDLLDLMELSEASQRIDNNDYDAAIAILTPLIERSEKETQYSPRLLSTYYGVRSVVWMRKKQFQEAANDLLRELEIEESLGESGKANLRITWQGLAGCYYNLGDREKTIHAINQSVESALDYYGKQHSETLTAFDLRSNYEGEYGMKEEALQDRKQIFQIIQKNVEQNFTFLTASERASYWDKYQPMTNIMFTFAHRLGEWQSDFTDELFNQQLLAKGLLLTTENALQRAIEKDPKLKSTYQAIRQLRLKALNPETSPEEAEASTREADRLERSLGASANSLYQYMNFLKVNVKDIKAKLKPNDVAIEFVDYRIGKDSTMYAALILSPQWEHVRFLPLLEEKEVAANSNNLNPRLWKPIFEVIKDADNIYFSPTGLLYQIPIESQRLLDPNLKDINCKTYRMSSTRWLAVETGQDKGHDAVIYGGLAYDMSVSEMKAVDQKRWAIDEIKPLPGTKTEAESIAKTINDQHKKELHAELMTGKQGTEASFKLMDGKQKRIIHVATHGFYHEKQGKDDPLSQSGLYFAGAENAVAGDAIPSDIEDGILTASEVAAMDLKGLDLVVLSACETGKGKITSDGVFGLQRGFKKAGANSILMSLQKVDDNATCLLMTEFYRNWIGRGIDKYDALEEAKKTVSSYDKWNDPKYWASFILLDAIE